MKYLLGFIIAFTPIYALGNGSTGGMNAGAPLLPCFVDNKFVGSMEYAKCLSIGGATHTNK